MKTISRYIMTLALLLTAATGAWAAAAYYVVGNFTDWSANPAYKMTLNTECTSTTEYMLTLDLAADAQFKVVKDDGQGQTWYPDGMGNNYGENGELPGAGKYTVYFRPNGDGNQDWFYGFMYVAPAPGTVTLNDTKTEASFEMPTYDANFSYELVRDMSIQMTATMGDGTDGLRYRVKKNEQNPGKYEPADMNMMQVLALVAVNDGIEQKDLTLNQDYFCRIYKLDEQTLQPEGDGVELIDFDFAPGLYALKAFAMDGSNYSGETALSNVFTLFQGYEVEVPAGEYITYYKDEALYVEDTEAKLYTITAVSGTTATADELTIAPANTPILVKNNGSETKTILLIPTTEEANNVTVYSGFKGTTEAAKITASTATQNNYAFNGKEFVRVTEALDIAANKAWLEVSATASAAPQIRLVFNSATGIERVDGGQLTVDSWYSLDGRRLPGKPSQKGVYIVNGKKVVIK